MKQIIRNILTILTKKEKQALFSLAIADVLISILDIAFLAALLFIINFYTGTDKQTVSGIFHSPVFINNPVLPIILFFILFGAKNLFGFIIFKSQYNFVFRVASRISGENLLHYFEGSFSDYVNIDSSVYMRKINQQPIEFSQYVLNGLQQAFSQVILITIAVIAILIYNPVLFILLLLVLVPPVFIIAFIMKKKLGTVRQHSKHTSQKTIQHLQEALSGYVESNVYGQNDFFTSRYQSFQSKLNQYLASNQVIQNMPSRLIEVFAVFGLLILILLHSLTAGVNSIPLVTIGAFMAAAYKIIPGIVKIINISGQVKTYSYTVTDILSNKKTFTKKEKITTNIDSVIFENVHFSYPEKKVLDAFNNNIRKGDFVGISGHSGKGKTTIINILLGFLSPDSGTILINNKISNATDRKNYWPGISYVKQQTFFIHDSILNNIILNDADPDLDKLAEVLAVTGVDKLIDKAPDGSDTIITENGKNFSGGQRQRIILARALYKNADLIILDEPFNELDETSEKQLLEYLKEIAGNGKIILLITHNKTALSFCNKKIMLDE